MLFLIYNSYIFLNATLEQILPLLPPKVNVGYCIRELSSRFEVPIIFMRCETVLTGI